MTPASEDPFRAFFERHPQPLLLVDDETGRCLEANPEACARYGYDASTFELLCFADLHAPEERQRLREAQRPGRSAEGTLWRHRRADGSTFYAEVTSAAWRLDGRLVRSVCIGDPVSRLAVSDALYESRTALAEAQELAALGSFETDLATSASRWSLELYRILGVDPALEEASPLWDFDHPEDALEVRATIEAAKRERRPYTVEHRILTRDGRERHVYERGRFAFEPDREAPVRVVGAVLDVTERRRSDERLRYLAHYDVLTSLANRTLATERLEAALAARAADASVGLIVVELDRFKAINEAISPSAGDRVLQEIAARLLALAPAGALVARIGGDEFGIVLGGVEHEAQLLGLAHAIREAIARPIALDDYTLAATASIGLALAPRDADTSDGLLSAAAAAVAASKTGGGNLVEAYAPEIHARSLVATRVERVLRTALERGGVTVAYQPIVDALTGELVACEALARLRDGDVAVAPNDFIPVAESSGLIVALGAYVLERACADARALARAGIELTMCVNVSVREVRDPGFVDRVAATLGRAGLAPSRLHFEITESAYVGDAAGAAHLHALAALGVGLAIDDFGTGYSALGYLKSAPATTLKIDRSFVADLEHDRADRAIVSAIIAVARNLDMLTVAEGVETVEQAGLLARLGCTQLQGYLFERALPYEDFLAYATRLSSNAAQAVSERS